MKSRRKRCSCRLSPAAPAAPAVGLIQTVCLCRATRSTYAVVPASIPAVDLVLPSTGSTGRKGFVIFNNSTSILSILYGAGASLTTFTDVIAAGTSYRDDSYTGLVTGSWVVGVGDAHVTELF